MARVQAPPTKILSSTPLSPAQAHAFLAAFTTAAEASKNDAHNGHNEIVLTNLKRIEQALIGIHVPRPVQGDMDIEGLTDMAAPLVEHIFPEGEGEEQDRGKREEREDNGENSIDGPDEWDEQDQSRSIPAVQTVAKTDKKADKKARRKEEKKQRAEQRMKEKMAGGDVVDDDFE